MRKRIYLLITILIVLSFNLYCINDMFHGGSYDGYSMAQSESQALPVVLSSFTIVLTSQNYVQINWVTQSETNNIGWFIYRSETNELSDAFQINPSIILGAGTTTEPTEYIFEDEYEIESGETYWYWLESREISGFTEIYGPVSLLIPEDGEEPDLPDIPEHYGLFQNYPNPFNPDTKINFNLKEDCYVNINIYNIQGELVKTFVDEYFEAGNYSIAWDVTNEEGNPVGSGIYIYTMKAGKYSSSKKMVLLK
jgi:hypothetical protein